jgi:hypothetical protein
LTIGDAGTTPHAIVEAAGRRLVPSEAANCFGCHSNGGVAGGIPHIESVVPGVGCRSCHEQAEKHAAAARAGNVVAATLPHLADLAAETGMHGPNTVRFQPYRLTKNSKRYDVDDQRIRCTTCHDPHGQITPIWRVTMGSAPPAMPRLCTPKCAAW